MADNQRTRKRERTWAEFKASVESQGVKDSDDVAYIDWREGDDPVVSRVEHGSHARFYVE